MVGKARMQANETIDKGGARSGNKNPGVRSHNILRVHNFLSPGGGGNRSTRGGATGLQGENSIEFQGEETQLSFFS